MEQINVNIIENNSEYELVVLNTALFEDYENILNYLMKEMGLKDIKEIDDFDTHYQFFDYNNQIIILYYNNSLGVSVYFNDKTIDKGVQLKVLNEFWEVLKKRS